MVSIELELFDPWLWKLNFWLLNSLPKYLVKHFSWLWGLTWIGYMIPSHVPIQSRASLFKSFVELDLWLNICFNKVFHSIIRPMYYWQTDQFRRLNSTLSMWEFRDSYSSRLCYILNLLKLKSENLTFRSAQWSWIERMVLTRIKTDCIYKMIYKVRCIIRRLNVTYEDKFSFIFSNC